MGATVQYGGAKLYPKQRAAIYDPARISIVEASTKSGKTQGCLAWLLELAMGEVGGRNYWWVSPVFGQADIGYRRMNYQLRPIARLCRSNASAMTILLPNENRLWFKSAERPDDLYGEDVWGVVMDEASRMREEAWHAVRSTVTATRAPVRMIGNVKGRKNFFFQLARLAEAGAEGMAYHRITCWDAVEAGVLDRAEVEASFQDFARLGREAAWRQLYEAIASDDGDNPFGLDAIRACVISRLSEQPSRVAGVDLAGRGSVNVAAAGESIDRDYTAIVKLDKDGQATYVDRFRKPHTETEQEIVGRVGRVEALVDSTGTGDAIVERLQRRGDMRVEGYTFTERSRQDLLERLALMIGEQAVGFPDGALRAELESFEIEYTRRGVRFVVPPGAHDDLAFALALAAKKLPWKRKHVSGPVGIESPGGSRWTDGAGADSEAWRRYQEAKRPTTGGIADETPKRPDVPLPVVIGGGGSKWQ